MMHVYAWSPTPDAAALGGPFSLHLRSRHPSVDNHARGRSIRLAVIDY
jgi:hypothetical protein